jgi:hypothetical protein
VSTRAAILAGVLALAPLFAPGRARAGTIYLLNGEEIDGEIVGCDAEEVTLKYRFGQQRINLREIRDVEFRPGESLWEGRVREALDASRKRAAEESARRLAEKLAGQTATPTPPPTPLPVPPVEPPPPRPKPDYQPPPIAPPEEIVKRTFGSTLESSEWGFTVHYPAGWAAREEEKDFFTFRDPRDTARTMWSFDLTAIGDYEADYSTVVERATLELDAIGRYHVKARRPVRIGRIEGQRTTGVFEKDGRAVRHDQVIVHIRRGVLVIHFFSPGAPLDESGVPDVEGVLAALELH